MVRSPVTFDSEIESALLLGPAGQVDAVSRFPDLGGHAMPSFIQVLQDRFFEPVFRITHLTRVVLSRAEEWISCVLKEAQVMLAQFRIYHNSVRPHSALGYRTPMEAIEAAA